MQRPALSRQPPGEYLDSAGQALRPREVLGHQPGAAGSLPEEPGLYRKIKGAWSPKRFGSFPYWDLAALPVRCARMPCSMANNVAPARVETLILR